MAAAVVGVATMPAQFVVRVELPFTAAKVGTVATVTTLLPHKMAQFPAAVEVGLT
jgi:hypothetical protein